MNLILYLLIKRSSSTFFQITIFVFIFGLPTLVYHKERTGELDLSEIHGARKGLGRLHETSDKYTCFQKILLLFQRITVISKNYNQINRSLHLRKLQLAKPFSTSQKIPIGKQPLKAKTTRKRKGKPEKEKKGEERYNIRNGT